MFADFLDVHLYAFQQGIEVNLTGCLPTPDAAHEIKGFIDHGLKIGQILRKLVAQRRVLQKFCTKSHPRDWRLEIVRHRGKDPGAIVDVAR